MSCTETIEKPVMSQSVIWKCFKKNSKVLIFTRSTLLKHQTSEIGMQMVETNLIGNFTIKVNVWKSWATVANLVHNWKSLRLSVGYVIIPKQIALLSLLQGQLSKKR